MNLVKLQCKPFPKGSPALTADECRVFHGQVAEWTITESVAALSRDYSFKNYYHTIAFVNAVAWICHQQNHHPDMVVSYNRCKITFSTHTVGGLTQNDFICAAKIDALLQDSAQAPG